MKNAWISVVAALTFSVWASLAHAYDATKWQRATDIFTRTGNAFLRGDVFVNTYTGTTIPPGCAPSTWCTVDVATLTAPDAKSVFLSGILIITHGETVETADFKIGFRAFGDNEGCPSPQGPTCVWYVGQTIEAHIGGGQRSNMATWVPVKDGKFQFWYALSTSGTWPTNPSYGVNLSVQAWTR
jgi:hypothetical protein